MKFTLLYFAAFASAFFLALGTLPLWRLFCLRRGLVDDPGHRKIHSEPVPLAGGLTLITGLLAPTIAAVLVLWFLPSQLDPDLAARLVHGLKVRWLELTAILLGAVGMLLVGIWDDKHELKPGPKFAAQLLVALLVAASGIRITLFVPSMLFSYAITVLWILTLINAFNFMDNMNGLCGGLGAIGAAFFAIAAGSAGQYLVALIASLTCGALLGFLPYNYPKAKSFLGDSGSHVVGYLLAVLAILPHFHTAEQPRAWAVLSPLLILAVPLGDLVWVVILRTRMGKPFWIGDNNHLSHRLVRRGFSKAVAVLLIWILAIAVALPTLF